MNQAPTPSATASAKPTFGRIFALSRGVFALLGFGVALAVAVPQTRDGLFNHFHAVTWKPVVNVAAVAARDAAETGGPSAPLQALETTRDEMRKAGQIREDFFFRIHVFVLTLPPLRDRKEDIPLLINHFLERYSDERPLPILPSDIIEMLYAYDWPGNVRELENAIERAVVLSKSRTLDSQDFAFLQRTPAMFSNPMSLRDMEKHYIQRILEECGWNVTRAAKILDINRVTLHKKIKRFEMQKNIA